MREPAGPDVDFDLHGFVRVRVLDPGPGDVAAVTRQLGPLQAPVTGDADVTVRFVDELAVNGPLVHAGLDSAADDADFYALRGKDGRLARTRLPLDRIGEHVDIVCERAAGHVPHLLAIINLTALGKGVLPLHASAFTYRGTGVLATGWAKGGKTETLLAFAARGATYVGDEWVYLTPDGGMHGVPEPIRLWDWHLAQLPELRSQLPAGTRARLSAFPALASSATALGARFPGMPGSALRRSAPILRRQAYVQVPPAELFGEQAITLHGRVDHVLLVQSHDDDDVTVERIDGASVAAHMLPSLEDERTPFLQLYRQFRFLFPHRRSLLVEEAVQTERDLLAARLASRPAHLLRHPYPMRVDSLVAPVESVLDRSS